MTISRLQDGLNVILDGEGNIHLALEQWAKQRQLGIDTSIPTCYLDELTALLEPVKGQWQTLADLLEVHPGMIDVIQSDTLFQMSCVDILFEVLEKAKDQKFSRLLEIVGRRHPEQQEELLKVVGTGAFLSE